MSVQAQIVDLLRDLQKRHGLAYLFISHDLQGGARARQRRDRDARTARWSSRDRPRKVFDTPETDYTKALMAAAFDIEAAPEGIVSQ